MATRTSSLDSGYTSGALSLYPLAVDDKDSLYEAKNNAETILTQSLAFNGSYLVVEDASAFPADGLIRVGPQDGTRDAELIYYGTRTDTIFSNLSRAFAGSRQNMWPATTTYVTSAVMAEHHNAVKDAVLNTESNLGVQYDPLGTSLNGILKAQETKYLTPKVQFTAYPKTCPVNTTVSFQNFSSTHAVRYLWDFGDGSTSFDRNPFHVYLQEGTYTVKLNVITITGSQGIVTKRNYITVSNDTSVPFFYVVPHEPLDPNYSAETAISLYTTAQTFDFVDQTEGSIQQRYWVFGDGNTQSVLDPDVHSTTHVYDAPGEYSPTLIVVMDNQKIKRIFLENPVIVI